ncbi:LCP family protein [Streptomyces sp. XC 2026]|uniref:LCP family protein n=1 Tax=Streptomyces sp. XC 2026 TaxID=2782004 RepID=UPI001903E673|nr:LCP family protein [Streptomyces sp. XC 2026]QQN76766.1 LCP family protein [Streptomyces sp. XC 2026]
MPYLTFRLSRRLRHILGWSLAGLLVVAAGTGFWFYRQINGNLRSVDINAELGEQDRPQPDPEQPAQDVLVLSTDSEAGRQSAMVVHLPDDGGAVTVVALPGDARVPQPRCAGTDGEAADGELAFGDIYALGGPSCVVRSVEKMSDIRMDHYLEVDFARFGQLADAVGGVTLTLPEPVYAADGGLVLDSGTHTLSGAQALEAARAAQPAEGDPELRERMLLALLTEVDSEGMLSSPAKLYRLADAATKSLTTDAELGSLTDLLDFAQRLSGANTGELRTVALPDPGAAADSVWEALRTGTPVEDDAARQTP